MREILNTLSLIDEAEVEEYYPRVRDRSDVCVLRCKKSGIIFLSSIDHVQVQYYEEKSRQSSPERVADVNLKGGSIQSPRIDDTSRRVRVIQDYVKGRNWMDFGTGYGDILDRLASSTNHTVAVEPNLTQRDSLQQKGYQVFSSLSELPASKLDVVTLFHVLEHLAKPIDILADIRSRMNRDAVCIIEVPHARDILLQDYDCDAYKEFTLWSEHLILHTRVSLKKFILEAGFKDVEVVGCQRYPLSNHLYWLRHGMPGGHQKWSHIDSIETHQAYENNLSSIDQTDTIVAFARN